MRVACGVCELFSAAAHPLYGATTRLVRSAVGSSSCAGLWKPLGHLQLIMHLAWHAAAGASKKQEPLPMGHTNNALPLMSNSRLCSSAGGHAMVS